MQQQLIIAQCVAESWVQMKYKVGDHILVEYKIEEVDKSDQFPYQAALLNDSDCTWFDDDEILGLKQDADSSNDIPFSSFGKQIALILKELQKTLVAKNHDYGDAFHDSVEEFGNVVMAIRIGDKYKRLKTLLDSDAQVDESIEDTLRDLAGYAILSINELDKANTTTIYGSGQPYSTDTQFPLLK